LPRSGSGQFKVADSAERVGPSSDPTSFKACSSVVLPHFLAGNQLRKASAKSANLTGLAM